MQLDLQPEDVTLGMDIWFSIHPKDSVPTMRTTVVDVMEDFRGKVLIDARGIPEPYPIYHFRKAKPEVEKYSSSVPLIECDDLYKRNGF